VKKHYYLFITLFFLLSHGRLFAQGIIVDTADEATPTGVVIHADPRLELLIAGNAKAKKIEAAKPVNVIRSGRGFRVQIYNGNERSVAISKKIDFMKRFPNIATYMSYTQPIFRVKVGDFRSRSEAQSMLIQLKPLYGAVMIVPDYIVINTFKKND